MRMINFGSKHEAGWLRYGRARVWITFGIAFIAFLVSVIVLLMVMR